MLHQNPEVVKFRADFEIPLTVTDGQCIDGHAESNDQARPAYAQCRITKIGQIASHQRNPLSINNHMFDNCHDPGSRAVCHAVELRSLVKQHRSSTPQRVTLTRERTSSVGEWPVCAGGTSSKPRRLHAILRGHDVVGLPTVGECRIIDYQMHRVNNLISKNEEQQLILNRR